jgi:pimeloyl-ACP methyl ester carboxylesterase
MPSRTPLVLLPGLLCDAAAWAPQLPHLGRSATIVHYGDADSIGAMAEAALAVAPPGRFAVAGHSMGGRVALELHRRAADRVERLALLDTGVTPIAEGESGERERDGRLRLLATARRSGMRAMAADWARGMVHRSDGPALGVVLDMFERSDADRFAKQIEALLARPDAWPELARIAVPTLVLTGERDAWSSPEAHGEMHEAIPGSRLVVVPDCGHMSTLEAPEAVTTALVRWLNDR